MIDSDVKVCSSNWGCDTLFFHLRVPNVFSKPESSFNSHCHFRIICGVYSTSWFHFNSSFGILFSNPHKQLHPVHLVALTKHESLWPIPNLAHGCQTNPQHRQLPSRLLQFSSVWSPSSVTPQITASPEPFRQYYHQSLHHHSRPSASLLAHRLVPHPIWNTHSNF